MKPREQRRLQQKEENLIKAGFPEAREESLNRKQKEIQKLQEQVDALHKRQLDELERISCLTRDEAKQQLLKVWKETLLMR